MFAQLVKWFQPSDTYRDLLPVYAQCVAQARQPVFYTTYGVADSVDGRFDLILLHLAIWLNATDANADTTRHIMELVIADMDQSLREMGVGDMSIGKKVDKMAFAMNGRLQAYTASGDDPDAWTHAIAHNVYRQDSHPQAERLADYALRAKAQLSQSNAELNWPAL